MATDHATPERPVLDSAVRTFESQKRLAERAIAQLGDDQFHVALDANTNSVTVMMKHLAGNMLSRWTDFLTTDGEKPWRGRDTEFVDDIPSREALLARWEDGWKCLFAALDALSDEDLTRTVRMRGEEQSALDAIFRQLSHYGCHVGQIVQTARVMAKDNWEVLTIPRGGSDEYNRRHWESDGR